MSRILVTGGLGYIGSHTTVELMAKGHEVIVVDNLSNTRESVLDGITAIAGKRPSWVNLDLADAAATQAFFAGNAFDAIIHFAAFKAVGESVEKPMVYYRNNVNALMHVLDYVTSNPSCACIFSSSCTVYGQADHLPISEAAPMKQAESPYGMTKQIGESMLTDAAKAYGLKVTALRYFNPIGAHPSALIGELPLGPPQNLVPFITQSAAGLRGPLQVYGKDYPTADGTAVRDYIHVVDLALAHIAAMDHLMRQEGGDMHVFNLGTGKGSSVLSVIQAFEAATGTALSWAFAPRRAGDVVAAYADTERAASVLGWRAQRSLADSMKDAWRWQEGLPS